MYNRKELAELFHRLGAPASEDWADSQVDEGINQLGRFLFLRQIWREVLDENDVSWIQRQIKTSDQNPDAPCSGIGPALQRLLEKGADPQDITDIARTMQYQLLFRLCYLLSDPSISEPDLQDFGWGLFQVNGDGEIVDTIGMLHESLLETDPTGREMRPRDKHI